MFNYFLQLLLQLLRSFLCQLHSQALPLLIQSISLFLRTRVLRSNLLLSRLTAVNFSAIPGDIRIDIELPLAAGVVHEPDLPEYGSFSPTLVVNPAHTPHAAHESVRIVAIQGEPIIEIDTGGQGFFRSRGPLQYLLCPVHPHEAVHLSLFDQLELS